MHWQNTVEGYCDWIGENICKKIADYLEKNTFWVKQKIHQHRRSTLTKNVNDQQNTKHHEKESKNGNPYWHHVSLFYDQLQGLEDGYDAKVRDKMIVKILSSVSDYSGNACESSDTSFIYTHFYVAITTQYISFKNTSWRSIFHEHLWRS